VARELNPTDLDAEDIERAREAENAKRVRRTEVSDFKWLMGQVQGRRFVWRLLEKAGVFRSTFRKDSEMEFLEGMRNMGLMLIADVHEVCPEKYHVMVKEQQRDDD
jgi:hypothetical protein